MKGLHRDAGLRWPTEVSSPQASQTAPSSGLQVEQETWPVLAKWQQRRLEQVAEWEQAVPQASRAQEMQ